MPAYYAFTIIRQHGEIFGCNEDYHAENPNIFHHHEMFNFLNHTLKTKGAWRSKSGRRLDFGKYTSKQVAKMMIDGLGAIDELGIDGDMPVYMRMLPLMEKGKFPQSIAEKLIANWSIQAVVSHRDPLFKKKLDSIGDKCAKTLVLYTNKENKALTARLFAVNA
jgi:hypothetical protein